MKKYALVPFEQGFNQPTPKVSDSQILEALPKNIKNKVRLLLNHIKANGNYIEWDEKGQVVIGDTIIPNSQIIDIIRCCFYPYKDFIPEGLDQFKTALAQINTPQTLLGGGLFKIPPPGLPTKKRSASPLKPSTKKQWVWHEM